jgi:hypothetical protein
LIFGVDPEIRRNSSPINAFIGYRRFSIAVLVFLGGADGGGFLVLGATANGDFPANQDHC